MGVKKIKSTIMTWFPVLYLCVGVSRCVCAMTLSGNFEVVQANSYKTSMDLLVGWIVFGLLEIAKAYIIILQENIFNVYSFNQGVSKGEISHLTMKTCKEQEESGESQPPDCKKIRANCSTLCYRES